MATPADLRPVRMTVRATETLEGAGFPVRRPFPTRALEDLDPFLLLDEMGPTDAGPGEAKGAPDHPHRGFETVTYLLSGEVRHRDSHGGVGRIGPGDVQWMTAGDGVVHSELPGERILAEGGRMHGFQLWVNLPGRHKRTPPRYQDLRAATIPVVRTPDGLATMRVIAGQALGASAATRTFTPILYLHVSLAPGGRLEQPVPPGWNAFAYVFSGRARVGREARLARSGELVVLHRKGGPVAIAAEPDGEGAEVLLAAGEPIGEPVARYGPFVMNTEQEIVQAIADYRAGRMGEIQAEPLGRDAGGSGPGGAAP
jgi:redox-sensitive bicupin YhaK (pirin superfamily)